MATKTYKELSMQLDEKIRELSDPNLELEAAVRLFKESKELYMECRKCRENMDGEIKKIARADDGKIKEEPLPEETPSK